MFGLLKGFRNILLLLNVFEGYFGYLLTCTQHHDQTDLDFPICSWETNGITKELEKMHIDGGKVLIFIIQNQDIQFFKKVLKVFR